MVQVFENADREQVLAFLGRPVDIVRQDVETIRDWITKQPHLPETLDDHVIERFLIMSKFYLETAKSKIDMYFTVRSLIPEFYSQHPCSDAAKSVVNVAYIVPLPCLTPSLSRIVCFKWKDADPDKFDPITFFSYFLAMIEIRLKEDTCATDTYVCDFEGLTISHIAKLPPMLLKKLNFLIERVFAVRSKGIYFLNAPSFLDLVITMISRHFKPKLIERLVVCKDVEQLHKAVPRNELPKDFDGFLKPLQEYQDLWIQKFEQEKLLFDHLRSLRVDESLRPEKLPENDFFGVQGNFRQLAVD